jgi:hypothetical protein
VSDQPTPRNFDLSDDWRAEVKAGIDRFIAAFPPAMQAKLDYSPASLDIVENWLLQRHPDIWSVRDETDFDLIDGAVFYVGECYKKNVGGFWSLSQSEPDDQDTDIQVIGGFHQDDEINPTFLVMDAIRDRLEVEMSQNLKALIKLLHRRS